MAIVDITYQRDPATGQMLFDSNGYPLQIANTAANTYAQMQARIANEVLGSPQTSDIQNAIGDAILSYERNSFDFNRIRSFGGTTYLQDGSGNTMTDGSGNAINLGGSSTCVTTVQGQEFYSNIDMPVLVNFPHITKVLVLAFNNRYPLNERTTSWIDDQSVSPTWNGMPTDWSWDSGSLRIYPIPNQAYPLIIDATIRFAPLVNGTDYNPWTNRAEAMIRFEAKRLLFVNIIRDADQAGMMERERERELSFLRRETMRRTGGPGRIRAGRGYM